MSRYLVAISDRRRPLPVEAKDHLDAAFSVWLHLDGGFPPSVRSLVIQPMDEEDGKIVELQLSDRKCRVCACTEEKACKGGCSWIAWDLCTRCLGKN